MKSLIFILVFCLFFSFCKSENDKIQVDAKFKLEFSDSTQISQKEILFYDSASHLLFLKKELVFNQSISGFCVLVNSDTIYKGIIYSCDRSAPPNSTFFISDCLLNGNNFVDIGYYSYSKDLRNDKRIINAFKNDNLLRNGLSCTIDIINVKSFIDYSEAVCKITIKNNDNINYYVLDPTKMGDLKFNYYTGGLHFHNINTKVSSFLRWSIPNSNWSDLTMNDFSILLGNSKVTYIFNSSDYYKMDKGIYSTSFNFCGILYNIKDFNLSQNNGRIWIGAAISKMDSVIVE